MTAIRELKPMPVLRDVSRSLCASPVFAFFAVVTVGLAAFVGLLFVQMALRREVFLPGNFARMAHGAATPHRVHDVSFGLLVSTCAVGMLVQFRRPERHVTGMVMALIPFGGLWLAAELSEDAYDIVLRRNPLRLVAAAAAVTLLLHPAGRQFFRSFRLPRVNWIMVALVAVAALPLVSFASTATQLQRSVPDDHAVLGHYGFMAALSFTVIGIGLLASLRAEGFRLAAWVAGVLPAILGVTSLVYPDAASGVAPGWALAAMAWGAVFVAVAERTKHAAGSAVLREPRLASLAVVALLVLGACSSDGDGVASAGGDNNDRASSSAATEQTAPVDPDAQALVFAECMRDNGVDMPDPAPGQEGLADAFQAVAGNYDEEALQQAIAACQDLMPQYAQEMHGEDVMLDLAECLREQGLEVSDNPFADAHGGTIDVGEFAAAMEVCRDVLLGTNP